MSLRTEIEQDFYSFLDDCDPSGKNTERLKAFFAPMDNKQFFTWMEEFLSNPSKTIQVGYEPFNNPVTIEFIEALAKKHDIHLRETVYKPYLTGDTKNPPASVHPVLVMDMPVKRLKQMVMTKSHSSVTNSKRDAVTGQVTGDNKTARVTDVEGYSLAVQELYACAQEAYGPMADDQAAFFEMERQIKRNGEVSLKDLPNDPLNKTTINAINDLILGSGLVTNIVDTASNGYVLPITMKANDEKSSTIER